MKDSPYFCSVVGIPVHIENRNHRKDLVTAIPAPDENMAERSSPNCHTGSKHLIRNLLQIYQAISTTCT